MKYLDNCIYSNGLNKQCDILEKKCVIDCYRTCTFFKTKEMLKESINNSTSRLLSLPKEELTYIVDKYNLQLC